MRDLFFVRYLNYKTMAVLRSKNRHYRRWFYQAPLGLVLVGFGASLVAEAAMLKYDAAPMKDWVLYGTLALIVLNSGLCLFGDAILHRVRYEREIEKRQSHSGVPE